MAFAAMLVGSATAFNAGSPLTFARTTRPVAISSRSGAVIAHDNAVLEQSSELLDARLGCEQPLV